MSTNSSDTDRANLFDRIFGLEKHEYFAVAWSFVYFFCVLSAYYMLRSIRDSMAVEGGVQNIPWLFSATFVVMLIATPIFGWVASRYPRRQFLPWVYYFFAANILLFWAGFSYAIHNDLNFVWLGRAFFVWLSIFNLFVVSVFWSFMADIYSREQGRRLFGIITAGGSAGAIIGPYVTSKLVVPFGFQNLLPLSAILLLLGTYCITQLRQWVESERGGEIAETVASSRPLGGSPFGGIRHLVQSKYLTAIAISSVLASLLGTAQYMFVAELMREAFSNIDERVRVFAQFDTFQNVLALILQLLLVNRVVKGLGIGITLTLLPILSLVGFAILAINPGLAGAALVPLMSFLGLEVLASSPILIAVATLSVVRRALGFGLTKPTTDMLYSVVTPKEKYKAKNFIETALYRGGDLLGVWTIRFMSGLGIAGISFIMLPFAVLWGLVSLWIGVDYRRRDLQTSTGDIG